MKSKEANLFQLITVAQALGDLLPHVTFVGGSTTLLLVDESAHFGIRKTDDIDVIVDVTTLVEYQRFSQKLRKLGFREDKEGPICRWLLDSGAGKVKLDVMPVDEKILGFSNRWYKDAINKAAETSLPDGTEIRVVSPAYFIATKFEAFTGRGQGDFFSHDLEDIVFVMENRNGLLLELMDSPDELKSYFAEQARLLLNDDFLNVLPGLLNNSDSAKAIENGLNIMSSWA
ncbi:MAG: nucleotidyl transferase AbiEii/AbiGii toxin family protein [Candidatus Thiodiazotropha endolucinida]